MGELSKGVYLKRKVTIWSGLSFVIGSIIGSGIFASPGIVLTNAGSVGLSLIIWAVCGVLTIMLSLCVLELALMIPKSGGSYTYLKEAFGVLPAFLYLFMIAFIVNPAGLSMLAVTFGNYVMEAVKPDCSDDEKQQCVKLLAYFSLG